MLHESSTLLQKHVSTFFRALYRPVATAMKGTKVLTLGVVTPGFMGYLPTHAQVRVCTEYMYMRVHER